MKKEKKLKYVIAFEKNSKLLVGCLFDKKENAKKVLEKIRKKWKNAVIEKRMMEEIIYTKKEKELLRKHNKKINKLFCNFKNEKGVDEK